MDNKKNSSRQVILIVDDNTVNHYLIRGVLRNDYELLSVESGAEMWEVLTTSRPDLILMDVMMPEVDGFELTRQLTTHSDYSDIPIVFLTAKDSAKDLERGFNSGGMDYIRKPFNSTELKARIKSVLKIKGLEQELKLLSVTDPLTKLFNRRYFFDVAVRELDRISRHNCKHTFTIAILDIDLFKKVNDNYGHSAGDYILIEFAALLQRSIRNYDVAARYGGEEFIVLFINTPKSVAVDILSRLKNQFATQKFQYDTHTIQCSFSCGLAQMEECTQNPITIDSLIRMADQRLYRAKQHGRNRIEAGEGVLQGETG